MKIIILGAGQVGGTLAENLVGENNDITIVDTNGDRLRVLQDKFDLRVVASAGCKTPLQNTPRSTRCRFAAPRMARAD